MQINDRNRNRNEVKWKPKAASELRKNEHIDLKSSLLQKQKGKYRSCI